VTTRNSHIEEYEREEYKAFHDDILSEFNGIAVILGFKV